MGNYVYIHSERNPDLYTVGFYKPDGSWEAISDHSNETEAAVKVHYLNGAEDQQEELEMLKKQVSSLQDAIWDLQDKVQRIDQRT